MLPSLSFTIVELYCRTHDRSLALAEKMTEAQLLWRPNPDSPPAAFHLWHMARWADYMQAVIPGMTPELRRRQGTATQLWDREGMAARWGFEAERLGYAQTGMEMGEEIARQLFFPGKAELLTYARQAFAAVAQVVRAIDETQFQEPEQPQPLTEGIWSEGTVGGAILEHIVHDNRHLGAMECLYGLQTGSGTATV